MLPMVSLLLNGGGTCPPDSTGGAVFHRQGGYRGGGTHPGGRRWKGGGRPVEGGRWNHAASSRSGPKSSSATISRCRWRDGGPSHTTLIVPASSSRVMARSSATFLTPAASSVTLATVPYIPQVSVTLCSCLFKRDTRYRCLVGVLSVTLFGAVTHKPDEIGAVTRVTHD